MILLIFGLQLSRAAVSFGKKLCQVDYFDIKNTRTTRTPCMSDGFLTLCFQIKHKSEVYPHATKAILFCPSNEFTEGRKNNT